MYSLSELKRAFEAGRACAAGTVREPGQVGNALGTLDPAEIFNQFFSSLDLPVPEVGAKEFPDEEKNAGIV